MNGLYRIAIYCAIIPMLTGVSIFLLWLITRVDEFMLLGAFILFGGLAFLVVGFLALGTYYWIGSRRSDISRQHLISTMLKGAGLLFSNLLMGVGIIASVLSIGCRYTVEIHNATQQLLDDVRVSGAAQNVAFGSIRPGTTVQRSFCIKHDGTLKLDIVSGSNTYIRNISGYVTKLGGHRHRSVRISPADGGMSVTPDAGHASF